MPCAPIHCRGGPTSPARHALRSHCVEFRYRLCSVSRPYGVLLRCCSFANLCLSVPFISIGTLHAKNLALQWRLPLAFACVGPLALLIGLYFLPGSNTSLPVAYRDKLIVLTESPRYLVWVGQDAKAREILQRIHRDPKDPTNSFADAEFIQIVRQIEYDRAQKAGYIQMFKKPSWRKRSMLVMFLT